MLSVGLNEKVSWILQPTVEDAYNLLKESLSKKRFIIVTGLCKVDYVGRAASKLDWGERVLLIKQDSSLLIHRAKGFEAVNWQPPGSIFTIKQEGGLLVIKSYRKEHQETLTISFRDITLLTSLKLVDEAEFEMHLSEDEMYETISSNPDILEPGFRILSQQRRIDAGVADFTGYDNQGRYTIVEVKRRTVDVKAVKQAYKYLSGFKGKGASVRGIIAAPSISSEASRLATLLGIEFKKIDLSKCVAAHKERMKTSLLEQSDKST